MYAYIPVPWSVWELTLHNILANGGLAFLCCRTSGENHVHGMACNMIKSEKAIHPLVTLVHQVVHQDRRLLLLIQRRTPLYTSGPLAISLWIASGGWDTS